MSEFRSLGAARPGRMAVRREQQEHPMSQQTSGWWKAAVGNAAAPAADYASF